MFAVEAPDTVIDMVEAGETEERSRRIWVRRLSDRLSSLTTRSPEHLTALHTVRTNTWIFFMRVWGHCRVSVFVNGAAVLTF